MYNGTAITRRTPLAEKVFKRAAEIERIRQEAAAQREAAEREALRIAAESAAMLSSRQDRVGAGPRRRALDVMAAASAYFDVDRKSMVHPIKTPQILFARQVAMYVAHCYCGASYPLLGAIFNRDHSTVMHSVKKIAGLIADSDARTVAAVEAIRNEAESARNPSTVYFGA